MNFAGPDNWFSKYQTNDAPEDWNAYLSDVAELIARDGDRYDYPSGGQMGETTDPNKSGEYCP
ncbi:MAG: hypothetical protein ACLTK0_03770 [Anaerovoracaceae bacterium]